MSNLCEKCKRKCCTNFIITKDLQGLGYSNNVMQKYPFITRRWTTYPVDPNSTLPRYDCTAFNTTTGTCSIHNQSRPSFCQNTGTGSYFFNKNCQKIRTDRQ